ncbi:MAG TPA: hypothetical protein VN858_06355 [Casimicrobiaceae bacterium]|nr:hypothetical protein [Casimicrobiaceae bacterium]
MELARLASIVLLLAARCAFAGPYEDGIAAYDHGDYAKSLALWLPLAEHGHRTAAFNVAVLYEKGLGTPQDSHAAERWYERAADEGDLEAAYNVGVYYETGTGVAKDPAQARKWFVTILENPQTDAAAMAIKKRARERLSKLAPDTQEVFAYRGGRFVLAHSDHRCVIALQGVLGGDTLRKFDEVLDKTKAYGCDAPWLMLESPGGSVSEGIELGREVSDRGFRTVTRYECASACALIFLAGRERVLVGSRAKIGFHQAAFVRNDTKERHCSGRYDSVTHDLQRYVFAVLPGAADNVMKLILSTSCDSIEWTAGQRALDLGIATRAEADGVDVFGAKSAKR